MQHDSIQFHNAGELRDVDDHGGRRVQRVPEAVRTDLNDGAQTRMCHPAGVELRFVPDPGETVSVTLSTDVRESIVRPFWGPFQSDEEYVVGAEPTTIEVEFPEKLGRIRDDHRAGLDYAPEVCRLRLPGEHRGGHVYYHGAAGARRPPRDDELPDRRYLAYGTSITEGEAPLGEHLTYVSQAATRLRADPINLGSCGTAFCDAAIADHIAARDDWDVATLAVSVNMVDRFSVAEFRERADYLVNTVAAENPGKPVVPVTIYPNARDVCAGSDEDGRCEQFRDALRDVAAASEHDNVHLREGREILDRLQGLTLDLVHPGDDAMIRMGENLAAELDPLLD
ncbi:SGNH/GDSL hydrolase family protein [Halarchaeum sp. P4]|uniref:SGNH/GDSL hydrolase family protein n=1 Tax=Halarchaeum sp. P4 TaxID=3421639 RepID=UPI003EBA0573